jgi:hypothetical protein
MHNTNRGYIFFLRCQWVDVFFVAFSSILHHIFGMLVFECSSLKEKFVRDVINFLNLFHHNFFVLAAHLFQIIPNIFELSI